MNVQNKYEHGEDVAMPNSELLPCPFCGGGLYLCEGIDDYDRKTYRPDCHDCDAFDEVLVKDGLLECLNRRATPPGAVEGLIPDQSLREFEKCGFTLYVYPKDYKYLGSSAIPVLIVPNPRKGE
jgi:hypothetical protein